MICWVSFVYPTYQKYSNTKTNTIELNRSSALDLECCLCGWGDSNSQGHNATRTSSVRVYQFRHIRLESVIKLLEVCFACFANISAKSIASQ
jgi:hypothetical protein